jgi:5-methylcytosine-specific restriction endonuclease McrA
LSCSPRSRCKRRHEPALGHYRERITFAKWEQLRRARIAEANSRCERCRRYQPNGLELHHRHYATLGEERPQDLELLCVECHVEADEERRVEAWWCR